MSDLEDIADAADLFVKAYYGDDGSIESALADLEQAMREHKGAQIRASLEVLVDGLPDGLWESDG